MDIQNSHILSFDKLFKLLKTSRQGLSKSEAEHRLKTFGPNVITQEEKNSALKIFVAQFNNFLMLMLILATIISFAAGEALNAVIIGLIIFASGILGFFQEYRSQKVLAALKKMASLVTHVIRDGRIIKIDTAELVVGDLIKLNWGDKIPADARIIKELDLEVSEAVLTGESQPVKKNISHLTNPNTILAERLNMVFAGTVVTRGHGEAIVVATGMKTEFGKIASMLSSVEVEKTPLEKKLASIGKMLGISAIFVCFLAVGLGILRGYPVLEMFIWGVGLAVAAVPEALPAVVTASLSLGVWEMAKKKAIVRRLPAVETLGSISVICSDKTGTLTKNEMTVKEISLMENIITVSGSGYEPEGDFLLRGEKYRTGNNPQLNLLFKTAVLCNDAVLEKKNGQYQIDGDPTEAALLVVSQKAKHLKKHLETEMPRIEEIPFDMTRKRMTTFHKNGQEVWMLVKGAPESILSISTGYLKNNFKANLSADQKRHVLKTTNDMASRALRVLAFAYKKIPLKDFPKNKKLNYQDWEKGLTYLGLMGMIDPPREEAKRSIATCLEAGIKPIIITGDHALTALAIGKEIGLLHDKKDILTTEELNKLSLKELIKVVDEKSYARVTPTDKLKIIEALQKKGHVVAMTGDGVNDAPALKKADIGVAMGIAGTDVAKEASDMVLADDNYATIVSAIQKGREIYDNIKKYLFFLLQCNIGEILVLGGGFVFGLPPVLTVIQILWMNLVTDGLPALALGVDPPSEEVMKRQPISATKSIFSYRNIVMMLVMALTIAFVLLPQFTILIKSYDLARAQTIVFATMVLLELVNSYNCRSDKSLLKINIFGNKWLNLAVLSSLVATVLVIQLPFFDRLFGTVALSCNDWLLAIILSMSALVTAEITKLFSFWVIKSKA